MIIYNPSNEKILRVRLNKAQDILDNINARHCFITGSFIHKEKYKDIDVFTITRSKKQLSIPEKKVKISKIDFNDLHSLFYHSISKSCISKDILPKKPLKVTISDYWNVINEAVPTLLNQKNKYHKDIRFLVLYTEYFMTGNILDTFQLDRKISKFKNHKKILQYINRNIPEIMNKQRKKSYLKRFFYTWTGSYKDIRKYPAQSFLYDLSHAVIHG